MVSDPLPPVNPELSFTVVSYKRAVNTTYYPHSLWLLLAVPDLCDRLLSLPVTHYQQAYLTDAARCCNSPSLISSSCCCSLLCIHSRCTSRFGVARCRLSGAADRVQGPHFHAEARASLNNCRPKCYSRPDYRAAFSPQIFRRSQRSILLCSKSCRPC